MKSIMMCRALVVLVSSSLCLSAVALAQNTATAGGTGGSSFTLKCGPGEVLVGLSVYAGGWIDGVSGKCITPNINDGSWVGSHSWTNLAGTRPVISGYDGASCDPGYAVKSFRGTAGWYVNSIILKCYKLAAGARTTSTSKDAGLLGGTGGSSYGPHACSGAQPAVGIRGKAATYLDSFGLICGYLMPAAPVLLSPTSGAQVTSRTPTFNWDPVDRTTQAYRICLNLNSTAGCEISGSLVATINLPTSEWTSRTSLPFARGDVVYWRVEACNENGCKNKVSSFRYMP